MTIVDSCRFTLSSPDLLRACACAHQFDPHMHDTFSVVVLIEGTASLQSRRWSKVAYPGDVFFFNPLEVHRGESSLDGPARYEVLYPSRRFVLNCLPAARYKSALPVVRTDILRRCAATDAFVDALFATASVPVETALCKLLQSCSFEPADFAASDLTAVRAVCQLIEKRYMGSIGTDMLARHAGLHVSHFIRMFHRLTGVAPQTYVRQVRIARARELICEGAELCDAAQSVGFCDQAHLTREFRKVYGIAPGRLARDLRAARG